MCRSRQVGIAGSLRGSRRYDFFPLPGQEGGQGGWSKRFLNTRLGVTIPLDETGRERRESRPGRGLGLADPEHRPAADRALPTRGRPPVLQRNGLRVRDVSVGAALQAVDLHANLQGGMGVSAGFGGRIHCREAKPSGAYGLLYWQSVAGTSPCPGPESLERAWHLTLDGES